MGVSGLWDQKLWLWAEFPSTQISPWRVRSRKRGEREALDARWNDFSADLHSLSTRSNNSLLVRPLPVCIQNNFVWNGKPVMLDNSKGLWHKERPQFQYFKPWLKVWSTKLDSFFKVYEDGWFWHFKYSSEGRYPKKCSQISANVWPRLVRSGDKRIPYGQVLFCEIFTILELFDESQNMFCFGKLKQPALN